MLFQKRRQSSDVTVRSATSCGRYEEDIEANWPPTIGENCAYWDPDIDAINVNAEDLV